MRKPDVGPNASRPDSTCPGCGLSRTYNMVRDNRPEQRVPLVFVPGQDSYAVPKRTPPSDHTSSSVEDGGDKLGDVLGDGGGGGETWGFDAYELEDAGKFAVGLDDEIGDPVGAWRNELGAQAGVGQ
jgi:hypothetical protein